MSFACPERRFSLLADSIRDADHKRCYLSGGQLEDRVPGPRRGTLLSVLERRQELGLFGLQDAGQEERPVPGFLEGQVLCCDILWFVLSSACCISER